MGENGRKWGAGENVGGWLHFPYVICGANNTQHCETKSQEARAKSDLLMRQGARGREVGLAANDASLLAVRTNVTTLICAHGAYTPRCATGR